MDTARHRFYIKLKYWIRELCICSLFAVSALQNSLQAKRKIKECLHNQAHKINVGLQEVITKIFHSFWNYYFDDLEY